MSHKKQMIASTTRTVFEAKFEPKVCGIAQHGAASPSIVRRAKHLGTYPVEFAARNFVFFTAALSTRIYLVVSRGQRVRKCRRVLDQRETAFARYLIDLVYRYASVVGH